MIVALALRAEGYDVTLQKSATSPSYAVEVEIDVVANRGESICKLYECKGRNSKYHEDVKTVSRHFEHRCAVVTDPYGWGVTQRYKAVEAIVVTSGVLSEDAKAYAQSHACSHGITCRVIDRAELITWFGSIGQTRLLDIVKRFFR